MGSIAPTMISLIQAIPTVATVRTSNDRPDRAGRHCLDLVEHPERQRDTFVSDSKAPVRVIHHLDLLARQAARERRRVQ